MIPIIAVSITTKSVQRKNYEIDQIIGVLKKIEIKKIFDNETKCLLIKKLIKDLFIGVIAGIVATVIVWFSV